MLKAVFPANILSVSEGLDFVEQSLTQYKFKKKAIHEAMLLFEESLVRLVQHAPADGTVHIHIYKRGGLAYISLSAPGPELQAEAIDFELGVDRDSLDRSQEASIRSILVKAYQDKIHYVRKGKYNFMKICVGYPERVLAAYTVQALIAAVIIGYLSRLVLSQDFLNAADTYVLMPVQSLFINFLMFVSAPAVFLSVSIAASRYASFFDPGKVSVKVFIGYALTSVLAVLIGVGAFMLLNPGIEGELSGFVSHTGIVSQTDFLKTVTEVIPSNIISPFLENNTLQLIFAAIICGIALGRLGDYSTKIREIAEALDALTTKIIEILAKCVPIAGFAATLSCIINVSGHVLLSLIGMFGTLLAGLVVISFVYLLIVWMLGGVNPVMFFRKCYPIMREAFLSGGSVSSIPKTIRICKNSLGISPKITSFSIPYGAIVNVDGSSIYLAISGLFLAKLCGVEIFGTGLIPIMITVFILSLGAPLAPGTVNICLTVLLGQMGVSMAAIGLIIGINAIAEMFLSASNVVGDVAVSLAVADSEGLLNKEIFNSKPRKR